MDTSNRTEQERESFINEFKIDEYLMEKTQTEDIKDIEA